MSLSERQLIEEILAPLARPDDGSLGLTDDAAFIACRPGTDLVVTQDTLIGGVHFRNDDPAAQVAQKALRVNLSDLAAKGGEPVAYFLSLGIPGGYGRDWAESFAAGLAADQAEFRVPLYGGDTVRSPGPLMITITVCGAVPEGEMVRRSTARDGDAIYVSGTIGDAALGLAALEGQLGALEPAARSELAQRFLLPRPRLPLAAALRAHASAAMDVSDGLVGDLGLLTAASGVLGIVTVSDVPLSRAARAAIAHDGMLLETALTGGDDYEILCTVPQDAAAKFESAAADVGIAVTRIGGIVAGRGAPRFEDKSGNPVAFARASYSHF